MKEYIKIETVYRRDMDGTKKLIEGEYRNETVEFLANNRWAFTEKIDGSNIRIHWDGHRVSFGGRTERAQIPSPLVNKLSELFLNSETEELFEQKFGEREVILFGEGYGPKIQSGGAYRPLSKILFRTTSLLNSTRFHTICPRPFGRVEAFFRLLVLGYLAVTLIVPT